MITDEMVGTVAHLMTGLYGATCCHKTGGHGGQHVVEGCECRATARAALTAVLPLIRAGVLEEAAGVAETSYHQTCCGQALYECCGNSIMTPDEPTSIAATIRAMKGTVYE